MGLDSTGLTVPRLEDTRAALQARAIEQWGSDTYLGGDSVLGQIIAIMASQADDLYQLLQALYDSISPDNATGIFLDNLAGIVGLTRNPATKSTGTITLTGTAGTIVPSGQLVEGDDGTVFVSTSTVTIGVGGTVDVIVQAEYAGLASAGIGEVTKILTPIAGWSTCTNAAAFVDGQAAESDPQLRRRIVRDPAVAGASTDHSIRAKLADLDYIDAAIVISNRSLVTDSLGIPGKAFRAVLHPTLALTSRKEEVATLIYSNAPAGIESDGSEVFTVTDQFGYAQTVKFSYATQLPLYVEADLSTTAGFPSDGIARVQEAITAYFQGVAVADQAAKADLFSHVGEGLSVGDDVVILDMYCAIKTVDGIVGIVLRVDTVDPPVAIVSIDVPLTSIATLAGDPTVVVV